MDTDTLQTHLSHLVEEVSKVTAETTQKYEKFEVALTGVLRLLLEKGTSIRSVKGSPKDLVRYLIQLLTEMQSDILTRLETIQEELVSLRDSVQNS